MPEQLLRNEFKPQFAKQGLQLPLDVEEQPLTNV
jgi:hypothetical protein